MLDALVAQLNCYKQMVSMNTNDGDALSGDAGRLAQFAADKARLMGEIEQHEQLLAPLKKSWASYRMELDPTWVGKLETAMGGVRTALKALIEDENELLAQFSSRKLQLRGEMDTVKKARKMPSAYRQAGANDSQHFDEMQ